MLSSEKVGYWFFRFLRRYPDPSGEQYWSDRLDKGEDPNKVLSEFLATDEYFKAAGGSPQTFVIQLSCDLHNHLPDQYRTGTLVTALAAGTMTWQEVAANMILSA